MRVLCVLALSIGTAVIPACICGDPGPAQGTSDASTWEAGLQGRRKAPLIRRAPISASQAVPPAAP